MVETHAFELEAGGYCARVPRDDGTVKERLKVLKQKVCGLVGIGMAQDGTGSADAAGWGGRGMWR